MRTALPKTAAPTRSQRPRAVTVFAAAFVAGAAAAVGVNRTLDVRLAQAKPRVESEAIFVALRSLPQGTPVTVWDVALKDWPKAMMPATALRASDTFSGQLLKHPLREGQPLLSIQLLPAGQGTEPARDSSPAAPADYTHSTTPVVPAADADLWAPAEPIKVAALPSEQSAVQRQAPVPETAPEVTSPAASQAAPTAEEPVAVAPAEPVALEPTAAVTTADTNTADTTAADDGAIAETGRPDEDLITQSEAAEAIEPALPKAPGPPLEPVAAPATEPNVATEVAPAPIAATQTAAEPTTTPTPPRPVHGRYLVVPERIAIKADTSFVNPVDVERPGTEALPQAGAREAAETVRPLPPAATAASGPRPGRPQTQVPQGRPIQRQGRQTPSESNGRPTDAQPSPQPRFGATLFPNLSAGMSNAEGRLRRNQPEQGETPAAARPVTAR